MKEEIKEKIFNIILKFTTMLLLIMLTIMFVLLNISLYKCIVGGVCSWVKIEKRNWKN
jgi:hypothetical protein